MHEVKIESLNPLDKKIHGLISWNTNQIKQENAWNEFKATKCTKHTAGVLDTIKMLKKAYEIKKKWELEKHARYLKRNGMQGV